MPCDVCWRTPLYFLFNPKAELKNRRAFPFGEKYDLKVLTPKDFGPVWYTHLNTCFQFLNNIIRIFTQVFKHMFSVFKCMYQTLLLLVKVMEYVLYFTYFWLNK